LGITPLPSGIFSGRRDSTPGSSSMRPDPGKKLRFSPTGNTGVSAVPITSSSSTLRSALPWLITLSAAPDRKLLIHHNITPARFFTPWDREIAYLAHQARRGLSRMAGVVSSALADSPFNARELLELGYPEPEVIPLIFDWDRLNGPSDESVIQRYRDGRTNLLFVGRVAPNKKQEDILSAFHYYQNYFNQNSRLILVGEDRRFPVYTRALLKRSRDLKLSEWSSPVKVSRVGAAVLLPGLFALSLSE